MSVQPNDRPQTPWIRGRVIGQKLPLKLRDIFGVRVRLQLQLRVGDLALFNLSTDSKPRGCDLVSRRVCDLAREGSLGARAQIIQRKTGRTVQFLLTEETRGAAMDWIDRTGLAQQADIHLCAFASGSSEYRVDLDAVKLDARYFNDVRDLSPGEQVDIAVDNKTDLPGLGAAWESRSRNAAVQSGAG